VRDYYALPRDLLAQYGRGPMISGALDFASLPFGGGLILGVHRALIPFLDDPERLHDVRAGLQGDFAATRADAEEAEDTALSVGQDGLALASRSAGLQSPLAGFD
jgi:hypothetical protein